MLTCSWRDLSQYWDCRWSTHGHTMSCKCCLDSGTWMSVRLGKCRWGVGTQETKHAQEMHAKGRGCACWASGTCFSESSLSFMAPECSQSTMVSLMMAFLTPCLRTDSCLLLFYFQRAAATPIWRVLRILFVEPYQKTGIRSKWKSGLDRREFLTLGDKLQKHRGPMAIVGRN